MTALISYFLNCCHIFLLILLVGCQTEPTTLTCSLHCSPVARAPVLNVWFKQRRKFKLLEISKHINTHTDCGSMETQQLAAQNVDFVFGKSTLQFLSLLNRPCTWEQHKIILKHYNLIWKSVKPQSVAAFFVKIICFNWQTANHLLCKGAREHSVICFLFCLLSMKHSFVHRQMTE